MVRDRAKRTDFVITFNVNVYSKTFFNILKFLKNFKNWKKNPNILKIALISETVGNRAR